MSRLLWLSIVLVAITAGTLHPNPMINGINDFPWSPILCISLSIMKAARAIYPLSSMNEMKAYRIRICGKKTITAPTPPITPSTSIAFSGPSGIVWLIHSPNAPTPTSIQSIGYCPMEKVTWNITYSKKKKSGKPKYLFVNSLSITCVV